MNKLAINGGIPVRNKPLPYGKQYIDDDDIQAVTQVLKSDYLTTGPKSKEFEEVISNYVGSKYAVAFSNGTAALHAACYAAGIKEGDEVITTPMTFAASANCVLYMGGKPVFVDINKDNFNIDPKEIEKKITKKTKAIIPVDYTGQCVDIESIKEIAKKYNLTVIQDSAHSLGTKYKGKNVGSLSDMTMFSFHPVKTITTGEGGMITTDNKEYYNKLMSFRTHCITKDKNQMINKNEGKWYYEQLDLGYNYRITDFQCALGISQLKKLDRFIQRRKEIVSKYNKAFEILEGIILQKNEEYSDTVNHLYIVKLDLRKLKANREQIFEALQAENIGVFLHYIPVYHHPYYQKLGYEKDLCPNAEELYESMLTVPLYPAMTDDDVNDVINAFEKVIGYYKK